MDSITMLVERKESAKIDGIFNSSSVDDLVDTLLLTVLDLTSGMRNIKKTLINDRLLEYKIEMPNNIVNVIIQYHLQANVEILDQITPDISFDIKEENDSDEKKEIELEFVPFDEYKIANNRNHDDVERLISVNTNTLDKYEMNPHNIFILQPNEDTSDENAPAHLVDVIIETPSSDYVNDSPYFIGKENRSQRNEHDKSVLIPSCKIGDEGGESTYPYRVCGKSFPNPSKPKRHEQTHTGEKSYSCNICGKSFSRISTKNAHEKLHTGEKPYACRFCGKCFSRSLLRNEHERIHTGEKPFSCSVCGKTFSRMPNKITHEKIHVGEKPYPCSFCGKCFSRTSSRNQHERIHTGEKPFSCRVCEKSFKSQSQRFAHELIHTGEKPFSCSVCGKSFTHRSTKTAHEKIHTREKPFPCRFCGKCFSRSASRNEHEQIHTGEKPFSCSVCGKSFTFRSRKNKHEQSHFQDKH